MKAFITAVAAMAVIGVLAWLVLGQVDMSAQGVYTHNAVRL